MTFTVRDGRLWRDGAEFVAVGVNYHPSEAGCAIWTDWAPDVLATDFRRMAADGLNTVRLFVFWRDFEPAAGRYRAESFDRLREAVRLAGAAGLACVLSVCTIFMNGQLLEPAWRRGENLWRDEEVLHRQEEFVRRVAAGLSEVDNLLALDLGDEIENVDPAAARGLRPAEVAAWRARLAAAIRAELPSALVVQATGPTGVFGGSAFGVDNAAALDLVATHGFPLWAPGSVESTDSYKATSLVPFLVRFAAAYGAPFVDEFGSYGVDEPTAARYLRAAGASALANGGNGLLVWCWQDITATGEPYGDRPNERAVGLRRPDGGAKPALAELRRLAASPQLRGRSDRPPIAVYLPERVRGGGESYLDGEAGTIGTFYAYLLLKRAHLPFDLVAGPLDGYRLVLCPSVTRVTTTDLDRLRAHVDSGGVLYYSLGDHLHGFPGADLAGAELVDFRLEPAGESVLRWDGDEWPLHWPSGQRSRIAPTTATRLAGDDRAMVLDNRVGAGRVLFCSAPVERLLDRPGLLASGRWERFYHRIAELAGLRPAVAGADPDVEIVPKRGHAVVINHGAAPTRCELVLPGRAEPVVVKLAGKDWCVVQEDVR